MSSLWDQQSPSPDAAPSDAPEDAAVPDGGEARDLNERLAGVLDGFLRAQTDLADQQAQRLRRDAEHDRQTPPQLAFGNVFDWYAGWLRHAYRRRVNGNGTVWRADWWRVTEAVSRLDALWRAWEEHRQQPGGAMVQWWLQCADPTMNVLMDPEGPFAGSTDTSASADPLPWSPPPEGWLHDERDGTK